MTIGALILSPLFDGETLIYTTETSNATNTITAVTTDDNAEIEIYVDGTVVVSGAPATWASGENIVTIIVTNNTEETIYVVTVTKS